MAKNGQINTNTVKGSYFWVKWEKDDFPYPFNQIGIKWSCGVYCNVNLYNNAIWMSAVTINNIKVYEGGTYSNFLKGSHTITSGALLISRGDMVTIEPFSGWLYENNHYFSDGGSFSLEDTNGATITFAPDFTDMDNPVITYSNPAGSMVTSLKACISLTGETDDVEYRDISEEGSSYTFELKDAERELLRNSVTSAPLSRKVTFRIRTEMNGEIYKYDAKSTFTVTENEATKPDVAYALVSPNNSVLGSGFNGLYIQGKTRLEVVLSGTGKYGAKIESYSIVVDGKTYNGRTPLTDFIQTPGEVKIVAYAKDSRGFTGSAETTVNVIEYAKPLVIPLSNENAIQCYRSDGNGKKIGNSSSVWVKAKRTYHSVNDKNRCTLRYRAKPLTEAWEDDSQGWQTLLSSSSGENAEYNALISGAFAPEKAYSIQIKADDAVGGYDIKSFIIPTQTVALHLGEGGKNVTIGDYCDYSEPETFRSAWKAIFDGGVQIGDKTLEEYIKSVINGG